MFVGLGTEPNFLHLNDFLLFTRLAFLTLLLVLELAEVHDPANRRIGIRRDLDQIEISRLGNCEALQLR